MRPVSSPSRQSAVPSGTGNSNVATQTQADQAPLPRHIDDCIKSQDMGALKVLLQRQRPKNLKFNFHFGPELVNCIAETLQSTPDWNLKSIEFTNCHFENGSLGKLSQVLGKPDGQDGQPTSDISVSIDNCTFASPSEEMAFFRALRADGVAVTSLKLLNMPELSEPWQFKALRHLPSLHTLVLDYFRRQRPDTDKAFEECISSNSLRKLSLHVGSIGNSDPMNLMAGTGLTSLSIDSTTADSRQPHFTSESLTKLIERSPDLRKIQLSDNTTIITTRLLRAILGHTNLKIVGLEGMKLTADPLSRALKKALNSFNAQHVSFRQNPLGPKGGDCIANLIGCWPSIVSLDLRDTELGARGSHKVLISSLTRTTTLRRLDIGANLLPDDLNDGKPFLNRSLYHVSFTPAERSRSFERNLLRLTNVHSISIDGEYVLPCIKSINDNDLFRKLDSLEITVPQLDIALSKTLVAGNAFNHLKVLIIHARAMSPLALTAILEGLGNRSCSLKKLKLPWGNLHFTPDQRVELEAIMEANKTIIDLNHHDSNFLRQYPDTLKFLDACISRNNSVLKLHFARFLGRLREDIPLGDAAFALWDALGGEALRTAHAVSQTSRFTYSGRRPADAPDKQSGDAE